MLELRGRRVSWVGIESNEPLRRGCDQTAWLDKLDDAGIRHVLVPLNADSEDTCVFARRHLDATGTARNAFYDLEHRDEGFFTRLKFLLEASADAGVLLGFSLFDAGEMGSHNPLAPDANVQHLSLRDDVVPANAERLKKIIETAAGWVSSAVRGSAGVYIEIFRNATPNQNAGWKPPPQLELIEHAAAKQIAESFARHAEDLSPDRPGPWVLHHFSGAEEKLATRSAPFDASRTIGAGAEEVGGFSRALSRAGVECDAASSFFHPTDAGPAAMLRFEEGALDPAQVDWLWRALFRGYWPVVALKANEKKSEWLLSEVSALAKFSSVWLKRARLRPCVDIFEGDPTAARSGIPFAAEDGQGRFFVYFASGPREGLQLSLPPGIFRYAWVDPLSGKTLDRGDGVAGGAHARLTGLALDQARLLVIEPSDAQETL